MAAVDLRGPLLPRHRSLEAPLLSHFVPPTVLQPRAVRRVTAPEPDFRDDDAAAVAKELMELGVLVNTGAHGQREGLATHWEMWSFAEGGMSPMQMLATATINPARYLGMDADLGSIETGKLADLQVVDGNPLEDVKSTDRITHVMVNGRLYRATDLGEEVTGSRRRPHSGGTISHSIRYVNREEDPYELDSTCVASKRPISQRHPCARNTCRVAVSQGTSHG